MNAIVNLQSNEMLQDPLQRLSLVVDNSISNEAGFEELFESPSFLDQLRKEKQRAQRSRTALSMLMVSPEFDSKKSYGSISTIHKAVKPKIRETDVMGYIDANTLGVLLPYTDKEGAEKFAEKIMGCTLTGQISVKTATYPDQIFESLEKNGCVSPDVLQLMLEDSVKTPRPGLFAKRVIDVTGALAGLVLLSPLMLVIALLVKMSSPGPIIFRQQRLGEKGANFTFYKFRSMRADTNDQIHREFVKELINGNHAAINNGNADQPMYKMKADPRITKVGKFIRKTSIDELPQLFNVLKGDMSLVGPRPPLPYEAEKYQSWHLKRILDMKPGITGLWQVEGRSRTGFNEAVRLDLKYLAKWSILLDIKILLKTVKEVAQCRGAA